MSGGGGEKTIPTYNADINDPSIPEEHKQSTRQPQRTQQPQPYVTLQVSAPPKQKQQIPSAVPYFPTATQYPTQYPYPMPYQMPPNYASNYPLGTIQPQMNVVNQLVIGDQNPYQNHGFINMVYEDALPIKHLPNSIATIQERSTLSNFIRAIILRGKDGNVVPFKNGDNNIFDRIKTTTLNPYHTPTTTVRDNPYSSLPKNMLIYRSCYPIKRDETASMGKTCSRDSIGMNIRIYRVTPQELEGIRNDPKVFDVFTSEVWRDIIYYEYIRENIIKPKICPNFAMMFGYSVCNDSDIDFEQINSFISGIPFAHRKSASTLKNPINKNAYNNDILTSFTESPTYNIMKWATPEYVNIGTTRNMVRTGFHPDDIWISVLFQLMAGLSTLLRHNIYINDFNLLDNVYIKDLPNVGAVTSYWKYMISNIGFYVPNYGFIVMIDSKFKDLQQQGITIGTQQKTYKMSGRPYPPHTQNEQNEITDKIINSIIKAFDQTNFTSISGVIPPSSDVLKLIDNIKQWFIQENTKLNAGQFVQPPIVPPLPANVQPPPATQVPHMPIRTQSIYDKKKNLMLNCIVRFIGRYVHNRVGSLVSKQEHDDAISSTSFNNGDFVIYQDAQNDERFGIYMRQSTTNHGFDDVVTRNISSNNATIGNVVMNEIVTMQIQHGSIKTYPRTLQLRQTYKAVEAKLDETDLLETYTLDM